VNQRHLARNILLCTLLLAGCNGADKDDTSNPDDTADTDTDTDSDDTLAPAALSALPLDGSVDVALNRTVSVTFSEALDPASVSPTTFILTADGTPVDGTVSLMGVTATFTPTNILEVSTMYDAEVTTGVTDLAGNPLVAAYSWSFTSGETVDETAPTVLSTSPSNYATDVAVTRAVRAYFSEAPDPATINDTNFSVMMGTEPVSGTFAIDGATVTFTPSSDLVDATLYDAVVSDAVLDLAGNAMAEPFAWSFTTGQAAAAPGSVDLQSAADFAVLAGSTVVSTGLTEILGNLGVSPGTAVDGFPPGIVVGSVHAGNPAAALAQLDLTTAYNDAAGRSTAPISVSGNLGGQTLAPGLYVSDSSLEISSGDLTLDGAGNENAVWIFQMPSSFTTTEGRQVILIGSAKAANVYWQVGSSATLGTTSVMVGNILADQSITLETGATLNGRALTRIGAVALDSNVIQLP
jgi:hypothetical protein